MDTQEQAAQPQSTSVLNRPVNPVIAILLIAVLVLFCWALHPAHHGNSRLAMESSLKGNLQEMREAIGQFHDDTGRFPWVLTELTASDAHHLIKPLKKGNSYKGPYLSTQGGIRNSGIPFNPFVESGDDSHPLNDAICKSWRYDAKTGEVHSAVGGMTMDGKPYQSL